MKGATDTISNTGTISRAVFKNEFVAAFPGDDTGSLVPRQTPGVLYSTALPTPVKEPKLVAWSDDLAAELGLEKPKDKKDVAVLGGNLVTPGMKPYAARYGGHQFGSWAGQLGDGRAITLGELEVPDGKTWELQLKGPGQTAYSRRADGRAVLRSSVREYLMSEAMWYLGVPTTRALSLVTTGEPVLRDMFYNGNPQMEPGAIVMRAAPTFLRFGNFEILAARKEPENLKKLVDWTIERYYPHITGDNRIVDWFTEVVLRTASLMVQWQRVGFVHGVMNTDNMSILGLTIDYGPYSFVDDYDPMFTPNTTDLPGRRYAFGRQPAVAKWNLACLAGGIAPLFEDTAPLEAALEKYDAAYWQEYYAMMGSKLGLDSVDKDDAEMIHELEKVMTAARVDMTIFFQMLIDLPLQVASNEDIVRHFQESFYETLQDEAMFCAFIRKYALRIERNKISRETSQATMRSSSPRFILRNYLLHQAIEELENGNRDLFDKLQEAMKEPYSRKHDAFFAKRPGWAEQKAGCSMLSCSS